MESFDVRFNQLTVRIYSDNNLANELLRNILKQYVTYSLGATPNTEVYFLQENNRISQELTKFYKLNEKAHVKQYGETAVSQDSKKTLIFQKDKTYCVIKSQIKSENSFYYSFLLPTFHEVWHMHSFFYLHAAAVEHPDLGTLIFIAPRGHGKSTISLTFLLNGFEVLSDDTLLFDMNDRNITTLLRPMHVDPELRQYFNMDRIFLEKEEYLPGSKRIEIRTSELTNKIRNNFNFPKAIFFPEISNIKNNELEKEEKINGLQKIMLQTYPGINRGNIDIYREFLKALSVVPMYNLRLGLESLQESKSLIKCIEKFPQIGENEYEFNKSY
ncbi:hypothetical protein [Paenibacillus faecalis]|uniref:hypothetical protein n=1 Tax=Paenibacillus faecalis TaxID=2079532 RepID=UPI000D108437|nr:hypothetical protein [Paenibacillus faecalis]